MGRRHVETCWNCGARGSSECDDCRSGKVPILRQEDERAKRRDPTRDPRWRGGLRYIGRPEWRYGIGWLDDAGRHHIDYASEVARRAAEDELAFERAR